MAKIITEYIHPPIPIRTHDWLAVRDPFDLGDPQGYGTTEQEAVLDLFLLEEMEKKQ